MTTIRIPEPVECHLWNEDRHERKDIDDALIPVKQYEEESHLLRKLLRCRHCGRLYFYEFYEEIDWSEGNDPQYCTWIPVESEEQADSLSELSPIRLHGLMSIHTDFPKDQDKPSAPYWFGRQAQNDSQLNIPAVVKVIIPVKPGEEDSADRIDTEIWCVNKTDHTYRVSTKSESFTTVNDDTGEEIRHGSPPSSVVIGPGQAAPVGDVAGWEWDGAVGISVTFTDEKNGEVIQCMYSMKGESIGECAVPGTDKKGRIAKPWAVG